MKGKLLIVEQKKVIAAIIAIVILSIAIISFLVLKNSTETITDVEKNTKQQLEEGTLIGSAEQLAEFRDSVNNGDSYEGKTIYLTSDIDLSSYSNWTPIGNQTTNFAGTFDGQGHTISNMKITSDSSYIGLFGVVKGTIKNLELANCNIRNNNATYVGGIVGAIYNNSNSDNSIQNCGIKSGTIFAMESVAGICGYNEGVKILNCYNNANITGNSNLGGIVGEAYNITIENCYNLGALEAFNDYIESVGLGGIVGYLSDGTVHNCYNAGGLVYAGEHTHIAAICGYPEGNVQFENCYYLKGSDTNAIAKTAEYMKTYDFIDDLGGEEYWKFFDTQDYPVLNWQLENKVNVTGVTLYKSDGILYGDVNGNGQVTTDDATLVGQASAGLITLTDEQKIRADVSGSGSISGEDASLILQYVEKTITILPVQKKEEYKLDNTSNIYIEKDEKIKLNVDVQPNSATNKNVIWTSSNLEVATVDEQGNITFIKAGNTTITVTTMDGGYTAHVDVIVDTTAPTVSFNSNGNDNWEDKVDEYVDVVDKESGVDETSLKYKWILASETTTPTENDFTESFKNSSTIQSPENQEGEYKLWILAKDNAENTTIAASNVWYIDNKGPQATFSRETGDIKAGDTITVTITDQGSGIYGLENLKKAYYKWVEADSKDFDEEGHGYETAVTKIQNGYQFNVVIPDEDLESDKEYIIVLSIDGSVCDNTENEVNPKYSSNYTFKAIDTTAPIVNFDVQGNEDWENDTDVQVTVTDENGTVKEESLKYLWRESSKEGEPTDSEFENSFINDSYIEFPENTEGEYYLWIIASDEAGNVVKTKTSSTFKIDTKAPVVTFSPNSGDLTQNTIVMTITDNGSGLRTDSETIFSYNSDGQLECAFELLKNGEGSWYSNYKATVEKRNDENRVSEIEVEISLEDRLKYGDNIQIKVQLEDACRNETKEQVATYIWKIQEVTGIKLNTEKITMNKNDMEQLKVTVLPENAYNKKVTWSSSDSSVVTVDENGYIKALKEGKAIITVISEDGNYKATCEVNVEKEKEIIFTSDIYYILNTEKTISKISPATTLEKFKTNITSNVEYKVLDKNGNEIKTNDLVGTGMKVILDVPEKTEYTLIVRGDINGDGECDVSDLSKMKKHIIEQEVQTGIKQKAADVNFDGDVDVSDLSKMVKYIIGIVEL